MINNFKDFKNYFSYEGNEDSGGFIILLIINIIIYNFRIENPSTFTRIIMSILILVFSIVSLIIIVNFINKEFSFLNKIIERNTIVEGNDNFCKETNFDRVKKLKIKLMTYATGILLLIDLASIFFYRNSVIVEIFTGIIRYAFSQGDNL